jgi:septum formation protein
MTRLILASASPARLRLLRSAGFDPAVIVSGVDESGVDGPARDVVRILAERKATAVAAQAEAADALVLGCDSLLELDGEICGKPATAADAVARWNKMRGTDGTLLTGHCVIDTRSGAMVGDVAATTVRFGAPSDDEVAAYVATGEPLTAAGAFTIDGRSAPFIEGVDGDPANVLGLSLVLLRRLLAKLNVEIISLWH